MPRIHSRRIFLNPQPSFPDPASSRQIPVLSRLHRSTLAQPAQPHPCTLHAFPSPPWHAAQLHPAQTPPGQLDGLAGRAWPAPPQWLRHWSAQGRGVREGQKEKPARRRAKVGLLGVTTWIENGNRDLRVAQRGEATTRREPQPRHHSQIRLSWCRKRAYLQEELIVALHRVGGRLLAT